MFLSARIILYTLVVEFSPSVKCSSHVVRKDSSDDKLLPIFNSDDSHLGSVMKELIEVNKVDYNGVVLFAIKGLDIHYQQLFSDILNNFLRHFDSNLALVKSDCSDDLPEDLILS